MLVSAADLVREYSLTVVCREADEIHIRTALSNSMSAAPLSFQSLTSHDYENDPQRIEVTATLKLHPKDQTTLEHIASRLSMEKGVSSVSWLGLEAAPTPE
jgi:putative Mg2+ transporter-C (MgtC) family protein